MNSAFLDSPPVQDSVLLAFVAKLQSEVEQLRRELRELRCDVGYWKSRHADAVTRNHKLQQELDEAKAEIKNLKGHPYEFYQKVGFVLVGVIPDANGPGKPDIVMAKRVGL